MSDPWQEHEECRAEIARLTALVAEQAREIERLAAARGRG